MIPIIRAENERRRNPNVVLIDDEESILDLMDMVLEDIGIVPTQFRDAREGINHVTKKKQEEYGRIDLVIQDLNRPGMGGIETYKALKEEDTDLEIIIHSGSVISHRDELKKIGANYIMDKPSNLSTIKYVSSSVLGTLDPNIYLLLAPPGYGKTTLIETMKKTGMRNLRKTTTRPYRSQEEKESGEIDSVSRKDFRDMTLQGLMRGVHRYRGNMYGISTTNIQQALSSGKDHMFALVDYKAAFALRREFSRIYIIMIQPPLDFAGYGLEMRLEKMMQEPEKLRGPEAERDFIAAQQDTQRRLKGILKEAREYSRYLPFADKVIDRTDMWQIESILRRYVEVNVRYRW